jgi:hypothetical protein
VPRSAVELILEGSGSLTLAPEITGKAHFDVQNFDVEPFCIGAVDATAEPLLIFDKLTLPLILQEADTVADFVAELESA